MRHHIKMKHSKCEIGFLLLWQSSETPVNEVNSANENINIPSTPPRTSEIKGAWSFTTTDKTKPSRPWLTNGPYPCGYRGDAGADLLHLPAQTHSACRMQQWWLVKHTSQHSHSPLTPSASPLGTNGNESSSLLPSRDTTPLWETTALKPSKMNFFLAVCIYSTRKSSSERDCGKTRRSWEHMTVTTGHKHTLSFWRRRGVPLRELISCWMDLAGSMLASEQRSPAPKRTGGGCKRLSAGCGRFVSLSRPLSPSLPLAALQQPHTLAA